MPEFNQPKPASDQAVLTPTDNKKYLKELNVSVGSNHSNDYPATKTSGIKIRGTGAAIKGVTARGPMC